MVIHLDALMRRRGVGEPRVSLNPSRMTRPRQLQIHENISRSDLRGAIVAKEAPSMIRATLFAYLFTSASRERAFNYESQ
jgi:hypothetical protein